MMGAAPMGRSPTVVARKAIILPGLPHEDVRQARPRMASRMTVSQAARLRMFFKLSFFRLAVLSQPGKIERDLA
ncbi:hypothetical protein WS69_25635 [Burkholderia sp. BDU5]|nr:hypothetical protein WS69_25635 [Burkholderia sp. BDU5]